MCVESSLDIIDSIEDRKLINRLFSTEVEFNVEDLYKSKTYCTELNETSSNTESSLDSFELIDCHDQDTVQIIEFNKEKLAQIYTFSKVTYGDNDTKLLQTGYKAVGLFISKDCSVISFYYCSERKVSTTLIGCREITTAYCSTQDFSNIVTLICLQC